MAEEKSIDNINKLKIVCKKCDTEIIVKIGKVVSQCPTCDTMLNDTKAFKLLDEAFSEFTRFHNFNFELLCKEEGQMAEDENIVKATCRELGFTYKELAEAIGYGGDTLRNIASKK